MKIFFKFKLLLFFFLISSFLHSQIVNSKSVNFNVIDQDWLNFEPDENYTIEGSSFIIKEKLGSKYYANVSYFLNNEKKSENSFGIKASWDRLANNFVDIIPEKTTDFKGIPIQASIWVWGNDTGNEVTAVFSRGDGLSYTASFGELNFKGWKKKTINLPNHVFKNNIFNRNPDKRYKFDRIRIFVNYREEVDNLFFFIDKFNISQIVKHINYDGFEIEKIISNEIKNESSNK